MQNPEATMPVAAPVAPVAPVAAPTTAPAAPSDTAGALTLSEWTRRLVAIASVVVVGLSVLAIVGVMSYRVAIDGNSSLTNDITTKLMWVAIISIASMVAALFGNNSLVSQALDKLIP